MLIINILIIIIISVILTPAEISAATTVTGHRGQSVQIKCSYESGYETYIKYLCRGECSSWGTKDIPVHSGSAEDLRFSLEDDTAARVFTINITNLRAEDEGLYWCGIRRSYFIPDVYTEILLVLEKDSPASTTVSHTTYSPPLVQTQSTDLPTFSTTGADHSVVPHSTSSFSISASVLPESTPLPPSPGFFVLYMCILLLVIVMALGILVLFFKRRKNITSLSVIFSSITPQRKTARNEDTTNDTPGNHTSIMLNPVYQSVNPSASQSGSFYKSVEPHKNQSDSVYKRINSNNSQSDSVYQSVNPNSSQSDSVYQSVNPNSSQSDSVYQRVNSNSSQSDPVYQVVRPKSSQSESIYQRVNSSTCQSDLEYKNVNPNTNQSDSVYQTVNHNTQSNSVYQSLNPNTNQSDSVYHTLSPNTNQSDPVCPSLSLNTIQSDSVYQSLNPNTNQSDSVYQSLTHNNNQSDSVYQSLNPTTKQSDPVFQV
ncbi:uncharacterized protein [Salminus brasiliensis]|uniref:uncharacterized protein n=1 Tax=Salminus brasiliensis TaxID=930266 RepID=UPI003B82FCE8